MTNDVKLPLSLKIVACLFLITGIYSVVDIILGIAQRGIYINFGVLGIPIFWGLLNRRSGWRICGLVLIWFGLIVIPIVFIASLLGNEPAYFEVFRIRISRIPRWVASVVCVPFFLLVLWEYRVLVRPDIKALFKP